MNLSFKHPLYFYGQFHFPDDNRAAAYSKMLLGDDDLCGLFDNGPPESTIISVDDTSDKRPSKKRKSVQFDSRQMAVHSIHNQHQLPVLPEELWYKKTDLIKIQRETRKAMRALRNSEAMKGSHLETRGLEQYQSEQFHQAVRNRRRAVRRAVLDAQRKFPQVMPEQLAFESQQQSKWSKEWALELAAADAKETQLVEEEFFAMDIPLSLFET